MKKKVENTNKEKKRKNKKEIKIRKGGEPRKIDQ